ncbi:MAG: hypothetical protein FWC20_08330 [Oscillospiraceae bacterium]|nr:hypothetical protein [Oscillospiraceae bacterium]
MDKLQFELSSNSKLNAVYFGLVLSGYEFATINKQKNIFDITKRIESYSALDRTKDFFRFARGNTCEVYPFWPRVALLESALFFIENSSFSFVKYCDYVNSLSNITIEERSDDFFKWVKEFPQCLHEILKDELFGEIDAQLTDIVNSLDISMDMENLIAALSAMQVDTGIQKLAIKICPLKCCFSVDYFTRRNEMYVMLGDYLPHSIVHEYLHLVLHPLVQKHKTHILSRFDSNTVDAHIDQSYYLSGDKNGFINAFEEHLVRKASEKIAGGEEIDLETLIIGEGKNENTKNHIVC